MTKRSLLAIVTLAACVSEGDIDRTQPNKLPKSLFQGTWYVRQTVIDVPPTSMASFVGEPGGARWANVEKIVWEIQEEYLIAWRAYEEIPGANPVVDPTNTGIFDTNVRPGQGSGRNPDEFHDNPVAIFPIKHFDIKRQYNAATGEESNVIYEDTSDRHWYERDYVRVEWDSEQVTSPDFLTKTMGAQVQFFSQENEGGYDAFRLFVKDDEGNDVRVSFEDAKNQPDASQVYYFDMVGTLFMEPAEVIVNKGTPYEWPPYPACILAQYLPQFFGQYSQVSCGPTQLRVRSSFLKVGPERLAYEPQAFDDRDMSKFGYFRTERTTYDRQRGLTESGKIYLSDRHNIWEESFAQHEDGSYVLDATGQRTPLPMADRTPKPIVYHLSPNYPVEMIPVTEKIASEWNRAFRRAVAVAQGKLSDNATSVNDLPRTVAEAEEMGVDASLVVPDMFVIGYNGWVRNDGGEFVYDETKRVAEIGDLRYNFIAWVNQDQLRGPLGYGPHGSDPETGEIITGTAYVYGAAVDRLSTYALDIVRLINGDVDINDFIEGSDVVSYIERNHNPVDPSRLPPQLAALTTAELQQGLLSGKKAWLLEELRQDGPGGEVGFEEISPFWRDDQADLIRGTKFEKMLVNAETARELLPAFSPEPISVAEMDNLALDDQTRSMLSPLRWTQMFTDLEPARWDRAARRTLWLADFSDTAVMGLAKKFEGRTDYDNIWQELREYIYEAVMEHEIGHTIGLRHNFAGSYDSINFFDRYWELRDENIPHINNLNGTGIDLVQFLDMTEVTPNQIAGRMAELSYSSIMDYASRFYSEDIHGIGKYDEAAILFGYARHIEAFDVPRYFEDQKDRVCEKAPQNAACVGNTGIVENLTRDTENSMKEVLRQRLANCRARFESVVTPVLEYVTEGSNYHYTQLPDHLFGFQDMLGNPNQGWMGYRFRKYVPWDEQRAAIELEDKECEELIEQDASITEDQYVSRSELPMALERHRLGEDRAIEVPYAFCGDELVGVNFSCMRWDEGADNWEQVRDKIDAYEDYYFFTHYKRDQLNFTSRGTFNRVLGRYFAYFPAWYQRWLMSAAFYPRSLDQTLDFYQLFATVNGFNELAKVMSRPLYGKYAFSDYLGQWVGTDSPFLDSPLVGNEIMIPRGEGRSDYSRYDVDSGYFYFNRTEEVGNYWDHLAAIVATSTYVSATALGVDRNADFRTYLIPYYLVFDEELTKLYDGIWMQDYDRYAPVIEDGQVKYPPAAYAELFYVDGHIERYDPKTWENPAETFGYPIRLGYGAEVDEYGRVDPADHPDRYGAHFSKQIYALLYGSVFFQSLWSLDFNYRNMVFRMGMGEEPTPGPGLEIVECANPKTGLRYGAIYDPAASAEDATPAVRMIQRCQNEVDEYLPIMHLCDDPEPGDGAEKDRCREQRFDVDDAFEKLDVMRSLFTHLQYNIY